MMHVSVSILITNIIFSYKAKVFKGSANVRDISVFYIFAMSTVGTTQVNMCASVYI